MLYFEPCVPCQALLGGVAGKGPRAAHGFGVPRRARSEAAGSCAVGWGVGDDVLTPCLVLQPGCCRASAGPRSSASNPLLPGNACLPLPSNDVPSCIATRIRVPSRFPDRATPDPSPAVLAGPRGSAPAPPAVAAASPALSAPKPWSRLTLTGLGPLLPFTCDFAKTRHQTRALTPGCWFFVCARARREVPRCGPLPPGPNPAPCTHAPYPRFCFYTFLAGGERNQKFELGMEVSGGKGNISDCIWAGEWVD